MPKTSNLQEEYIVLECVGCGANLNAPSTVEIEDEGDGICIVINNNKTLKCDNCGKRYMRKTGKTRIGSASGGVVVHGNVKGNIVTGGVHIGSIRGISGGKISISQNDITLDYD